MTINQFNCNHQETKNEWIPAEINYASDEEKEGRWITRTLGTWENTGIHTYKCTKCNLSFNYSGGNPHHAKMIEDCIDYS